MKTLLNKTKLMLLAVTAVTFALSSCGSKENEKKAPEHTIKATIATAQLTDYPVIYSFSGKLQADKQSNLSTRIMGQVQKVYVKPGQQVKAGDLLIQIRNQDILAKQAQVEANKVEATTAYESAEKDLKRFEALYKSNSASEKEMDDIRSRYQMAKARVEAVNQMDQEVQESLRYAAIRAPYNGVITGKFVQDGDMANPGMPLLSIESPNQWKVFARIPENEIAQLQLNAPVKVQFSSVPGLEVQGTISEINPSSTNTGSQFEAKILLNTSSSEAKQFYTGMFATVNYEQGTQPMVLIPQSSLVTRGQLVGLYTVSQAGTSLLRWVRTGKSHGDSIEILSGLTDGEKYILSSEGKLVDGALVVTQ
ncbi:efflux RND transporter periplasmic adaptor subunit [Mangrovibacterium lignilyticum]|uniref:efflux RND transporter periplasmic adaptor subunit n=1 Tax=Mangrovibacterium lignilyticum TaxID=2668052 RepID=UPI0013D51CDE|nr:efflux RND transporter periplasmic adaptor subunit [Mangrovibacterium lignilyticum]